MAHNGFAQPTPTRNACSNRIVVASPRCKCGNPVPPLDLEGTDPDNADLAPAECEACYYRSNRRSYHDGGDESPPF